MANEITLMIGIKAYSRMGSYDTVLGKIQKLEFPLFDNLQDQFCFVEAPKGDLYVIAGVFKWEPDIPRFCEAVSKLFQTTVVATFWFEEIDDRFFEVYHPLPKQGR